MILAASRKQAICLSLTNDSEDIYESIQELFEELGEVTVEKLYKVIFQGREKYVYFFNEIIIYKDYRTFMEIIVKNIDVKANFRKNEKIESRK